MNKLGILDKLFGRKKKRAKKIHGAKVDFYSIPSTFEVDIKRVNKSKGNKKGVEDDFNPKSKLWKKRK